MIVFEAHYFKNLGLLGYSSHRYSVTVRSELSDLNQVDAESKRLYGLLQTSVDREIQQTGFLPEGGRNGNNGNGGPRKETWNCTDKQRDLILKIVDENHLDKANVENLA